MLCLCRPQSPLRRLCTLLMMEDRGHRPLSVGKWTGKEGAEGRGGGMYTCTCALCIVFPCGHNSPPFCGRHVFFAWLNALFLLFIHRYFSSLVLRAHMLGMMPLGGGNGRLGIGMVAIVSSTDRNMLQLEPPVEFLLFLSSFFRLSSTRMKDEARSLDEGPQFSPGRQG